MLLGLMELVAHVNLTINSFQVTVPRFQAVFLCTSNLMELKSALHVPSLLILHTILST
jgi:hypothetical protein